MAIHDKKTVLNAMRNRWEQALLELCGWDRKTFDGNHQACPVCGGVDRFRWGHKKPRQREEGFAYCSGDCGGSHDGMFWFMRARGQRFNEAVNDLGDWIGGLTPAKMDQIAKASKALAKSKQSAASAEIPHERVINLVTAGRRPGSAYLPCRKIGEAGASPFFCNLARVDPDFSVKFAAGLRTWGAVAMIHPAEGLDDGPIYIISDPVMAARMAEHKGPARGCEVWIGFTPLNCREVAARYTGDREVRMVALDPDEVYLYRDCGRVMAGADLVGAFG